MLHSPIWICAGETGRSRGTSGSVWQASTRSTSGRSSAPVVAVSGGGGDTFVAILLGCAGAFIVIVVFVSLVVLLKWRSKRSPAEQSPLKTCTLSNTRCTNFNLNYLSPSPAPARYSTTAKVINSFIIRPTKWHSTSATAEIKNPGNWKDLDKGKSVFWGNFTVISLNCYGAWFSQVYVRIFKSFLNSV